MTTDTAALASLFGPALTLAERLRDRARHDTAVDPLKLLIEAANALDRNEAHYQAAMAMSEKHRKLWVEAEQKLAAANAAREAAEARNSADRTYIDDLLTEWPQKCRALEARLAAAEKALIHAGNWIHSRDDSNPILAEIDAALNEAESLRKKVD